MFRRSLVWLFAGIAATACAGAGGPDLNDPVVDEPDSARVAPVPVAALMTDASPGADSASQTSSADEVVAATDFEAWKQQRQEAAGDRQAGFEAFKEAELAEFAAYKKAYLEEFEAYTKRIREQWDEARMTGPSTWVEYDPDYSARREVDYEANEIRVTVKEQPDRNVNRALLDQLQTLLATDVATAYERDPLAANVEKKLPKTPDTETGEPDQEPVLKEVFDEADPGSEAVKEKTKALAKKGALQRVKAKSAETPQASDEYAIQLTIPLPEARILNKAKEYLPRVAEQAEKWQIEQALILAITHAESHFNPMAKSHIPAYGLMQIVPKSAGLDASRKIYGKSKLLTPSYLYTADKNIQVGAAYLNVLFYSYLDDIEDLESRLYCAIAAYNTGAGNVAKAFTGQMSVSRAAERINRMDPQAVYAHLVKNLPYDETKNYLKKVTKRIQAYREML